MTLLDHLAPAPVGRAWIGPRAALDGEVRYQIPDLQPTTRRQRWSRPARRTQAARIAAKVKLDEALRQTRDERAARWNAEELARQARPTPPGVEPVAVQAQPCEMCGALVQDPRCNVPCPSCGWTRRCEP